MTDKALTIAQRIALMNYLPTEEDNITMEGYKAIYDLVDFTETELRKGKVVKNDDGSYSEGYYAGTDTVTFSFTSGMDTIINGLFVASDTAGEITRELISLYDLWVT